MVMDAVEKAKALDMQAQRKSVVGLPEEATASPPGNLMSTILWAVGQVADEISPWGWQPRLRDRQLRQFYPTESYFESALGTVCSRNVAFSWKLEGPPRVTARIQDVLENSDFGEGWESLMAKLSIDLYTQDAGAFVEVVRDGDGPEAPLIGLNPLDAAHCYHTGVPAQPVVYEEHLTGKYHLLNEWQVLTLTELPVPQVRLRGYQICALSRMLRAAQVIRNISIYQEEKTGGRFTRALHIVKGLTTSQIEDALKKLEMSSDNRGLLRYIQPLIVGTVDPKADIGTATLDLAKLPEGFNQEESFRTYIAVIAMAFLTDYQEFAPMPGGQLGTSQQSQTMHQKSRGKGPGLFMKLLARNLNFKVLPKDVTFSFDEQDIEAEQAQAQVRKTRADTYLVYSQADILPAEGLRQLAYDAGDIPQEMFDRLGGVDITPKTTVTDEEEAMPEGAKPPVVPSPTQTPPKGGSAPPPPAAKEGSRLHPFWEKQLVEASPLP